jgi:hypothetical protein
MAIMAGAIGAPGITDTAILIAMTVTLIAAGVPSMCDRLGLTHTHLDITGVHLTTGPARIITARAAALPLPFTDSLA